MKISNRKVTDIFKNIVENEKAIVDIILMEKEHRYLSYTDLARKLVRSNCSWTKQWGGLVPSLAEKIRQSLENKKPDPELLESLCVTLRIEDNLNNRIKAYRYHNLIHAQNSKKGRVSTTEHKQREKAYYEIKQTVEATYGTTIEEAVINGGADVYYDGEWIDSATYEMLIEEKDENEIIRKIVLVHEQYPKLLQEFLEQFYFEKDTE